MQLNTDIPYKIFLDLDGVITDLEKRAIEIFRIYGLEVDEFDENSLDAMSTLWKFLKKAENDNLPIWEELDFMSDGKELWEYVKKYDNTEILTATGHTITTAASQKIKWVQHNLSNTIKINLVEAAVEKCKFANKYNILIDDKPKAIKPWIAKGGIGILHINTVNTIKELTKLSTPR